MSSPENPRLGWIGLGSMGLAMATNIQKHIQQQHNRLPPLKYWNRTLARGKPLEELGATACDTIADLVQSCDVIFISVNFPLHPFPEQTQHEWKKESRKLTHSPGQRRHSPNQHHNVYPVQWSHIPQNHRRHHNRPSLHHCLHQRLLRPKRCRLPRSPRLRRHTRRTSRPTPHCGRRPPRRPPHHHPIPNRRARPPRPARRSLGGPSPRPQNNQQLPHRRPHDAPI